MQIYISKQKDDVLSKNQKETIQSQKKSYEVHLDSRWQRRVIR